MRLRKIVKNSGHSLATTPQPNLLVLTVRNIQESLKMPWHNRKQAANHFAIMFGERFTNAVTELRDSGSAHGFLTRFLNVKVNLGAMLVLKSFLCAFITTLGY
jgi:hypothetical protein